MASNVFREVSSGKGIFKDEDLLSPEFLPDRLPGRENEERELASALEPAARGGRASNLFIHGPPGTGKTSVCRHVLKQLQEFSGKPLCVYVNCWQHATRQGVLAQLAQEVGEPLPRRGLAADEVFSRVCQRLKYEKRVPVVVLDEADRLFIGSEHAVLYDFSRAAEMFGVHFSIVMVTNDSGMLSRTDGRVRSSLSPKETEFKAYSPSDLKKILAERAALAFVPGACGEEVIALCAAHGAKAGGDARVALHALWLAGKNASSRVAKAVSLDDARAAFSKTGSSAEQKRSRDEELLSAGEGAVVEMLKAAGGSLTSAEIYALFEKKALGSERSVRNYLSNLEEKKLVESKTQVDGSRLVKLVA
jgi:cell division control protein 6